MSFGVSAGPAGVEGESKHDWATDRVRFVLFGFIVVLAAWLSFPRAAMGQADQSKTNPAAQAPMSALPDAPDALGSDTVTASDSTAPGTVQGVVTDYGGAVYEGARVTLQVSSPARAPERVGMSDANGRFVFTAVPAGAFKIVVSSTGFKTQSLTGVLQPGQIYEAPAIILPMSSESSEVWVSASTVEIAQEQVKEEEKQRVLGFIPNFYIAYAPNAAPLTPRQKFSLAWRSSIDPITILASGFFAGVEQADNSFSGYGQGAQGYAKRFGANYADAFNGTIIGGAILPVLFKQDPRYFYKGTGSKRSRFLYAVAMTVVQRSDKGRWEPGYSAILGGLAASGVSNLYYPAANRTGLSLTFENDLIATAESAATNVVQEFFIRKLTPKVPNYGSSPKP